jgi:hypothetical protein
MATKTEIWANNDWLKDAMQYKGQPIDDGIHYGLQNYYNDCCLDFMSARCAQTPPSWLPELAEAVNEISLIILYGNPFP